MTLAASYRRVRTRLSPHFVAIAARLDQLVYFLGMAKAESEIFVRTYGAPEAERAEEESDEPAVGLHQEKNSFD
jgi:hypothetical protein